jgi:hypothetical protein
MPNPFEDQFFLDSIIQLLDIPDLPDDLRREITLASKELSERFEITYPTRARIEYYIHQYQGFIEDLRRRKPI